MEYHQIMKLYTFIFFFFTHGIIGAELQQITIGKQEFSIVMQNYDVYDSKGEVMKLYKDERNNDLTFVFNHTLYDITGTCGDKTIQEGAYEINGSTMTLYSFWDRRGKMNQAPYGARVTQYRVTDDHHIVQTSSLIYIESERKDYSDESAVKYLFKAPENKQEQKALDAYVEEIEREFKGTFVFGDDAKKLVERVKNALRQKIQKRWKEYQTQ